MNREEARDVLKVKQTLEFIKKRVYPEEFLALETLLQSQEPEWISLKDRPLTKEDFGQWFWVCEKCRSISDRLFLDIYATTWHQWEGGFGFHVTGSQVNENITHYMRIGAEPKSPFESSK